MLDLKVEAALRLVWSVLPCLPAPLAALKQCLRQPRCSNLWLFSGIFHILGQGKSFGTFQGLLNHQAGERCQLSATHAHGLLMSLSAPLPGSVDFQNLTSPHPEALSHSVGAVLM